MKIIRCNIDLYNDQLNTYAYIWQELYKQALDETAIICTDYPESVKEALLSGDESRIEHALQQWEPVIPLAFDPEKVSRTIQEFGDVVDQIEEYHLAIPNT